MDTVDSSSSSEKPSLVCPRCSKVFVTECRWKKHLEKPSQDCIKEEARLARSEPPSCCDSLHVTAAATTNLPLHERLSLLRPSFFIPDHIPTNVRHLVATALADSLVAVVTANTVQTWTNLLLFCFSVIARPRCGPKDCSESISSYIRKNITDRKTPEPLDTIPSTPPSKSRPPVSLAKQVGRKLQDGNLAGAARLLIGQDAVLKATPEVIEELRSKHPENKPLLAAPAIQQRGIAPVTPEEVRASINTFPKGSAAGPDRLRPNHLRELISVKGDAGLKLVTALAGFCNFVFLGTVPEAILPVLFGANLFSLAKKDNGIRPIAVGNTLRRLVAKIVSKRCVHLSATLRPRQLGYAAKGGCEASVHAARSFIESHMSHPIPQVLLKLDVRNAFNSVDRNQILRCAAEETPDYYPFIRQCYGNPSFLLCENKVILSQSGVQQGDPIGPLLYCLATSKSHRNLISPLAISYLDDDLLAGPAENVLADLRTINAKSAEMGLYLNIEKCEFFSFGGSHMEREAAKELFLQEYPDISVVTAGNLDYLGSPLTDAGIPKAVTNSMESLNQIGSRISQIPSHHALFILKNCFGPVKLLYLLRTSRAYGQPHFLVSFDERMRSLLAAITNVALSGSAWSQASLPVSSGGLGVRSADGLSLPAFLSSAHSVRPLLEEILETDFDAYVRAPEEIWMTKAGRELPEISVRASQKRLDTPLAEKVLCSVKCDGVHDPSKCARLLAVQSKDASSWLHALPVSSLGNFLDDQSLRIAVALRLGIPVAAPHRCICNAHADSFGHHALSCSMSAGRLCHHTQLNAIIKSALHTAGYPSTLEPVGLSLVDGKRPDGLSLVPWERGKCLLWDATCSCTLAISNIGPSSNQAGSASSSAERRKMETYKEFLQNYCFLPLGFETIGAWGPAATKFVATIGKKIFESTGEIRSVEFLKQRLSIAIQRGNAASVLGTLRKIDNRVF